MSSPPPSDETAREPAPIGVPLEAVADPRLLRLVESRFRPNLVRSHALPRYAAELPHHLDPATWRAGFLAVHEGGAPLDVREALQEATPQAHLRDLFRPVFSEARVPLELSQLPLDPGGRAAWTELRDALRREPVPVLGRVADVLAETRASWRAFLDSPWQPHLRDDEPRREVFVAIEPSFTA